MGATERRPDLISLSDLRTRVYELQTESRELIKKVQVAIQQSRTLINFCEVMRSGDTPSDRSEGSAPATRDDRT